MGKGAPRARGGSSGDHYDGVHAGLIGCWGWAPMTTHGSTTWGTRVLSEWDLRFS